MPPKEKLPPEEPIETPPDSSVPPMEPSLDLVPFDEPDLSPPTEDERSRSERGSISASELGSRAKEIISIAADSTVVAYHGLRMWIAEKRQARAEKVREKMDHKDSLYSYLGMRALGKREEGSTPTTGGRRVAHAEKPRPKTASERFMAKRTEKKLWKKELKEAERARVARGHGGDVTSLDRVFTKIDTSKRKRKINQRFKSGETDVFDLQRQLREAALPQELKPHETRDQRISREEETYANIKLKRNVRQPVLRRWRDVRRKGAIKRIDRQRRVYDRHAERRAERR